MIRVEFVQPDGTTIAVQCDPGRTLMHVAREHAVAGIDAECGGYAECGTCHIHVDEPWLDTLPQVDADEESMLEFLPVPRTNSSRLACQILLTEHHDGLVARVAGGPDGVW